MVFLPLAEAQAYFNRADDVSAIEIFIEASPDRVDEFRRPVETPPGGRCSLSTGAGVPRPFSPHFRSSATSCF